MSKYASLISSIVNNPGAHIVDREEKMQRTIKVMDANLEKKLNQKGGREFNDTRGYGEGRYSGD